MTSCLIHLSPATKLALSPQYKQLNYRVGVARGPGVSITTVGGGVSRVGEAGADVAGAGPESVPGCPPGVGAAVRAGVAARVAVDGGLVLVGWTGIVAARGTAAMSPSTNSAKVAEIQAGSFSYKTLNHSAESVRPSTSRIAPVGATPATG